MPGKTNLIELVFDKDGKTSLRIHKVIWQLIRGSNRVPNEAEEESYVSLDLGPSDLGEIEITLPFGPVDIDCRCPIRLQEPGGGITPSVDPERPTK